jgi:hypothetical protein
VAQRLATGLAGYQFALRSFKPRPGETDKRGEKEAEVPGALPALEARGSGRSKAETFWRVGKRRQV